MYAIGREEEADSPGGEDDSDPNDWGTNSQGARTADVQHREAWAKREDEEEKTRERDLFLQAHTAIHIPTHLTHDAA